MLVAPPGYGKTTLAEQWAGQGRAVGWIRARRSSADVAVLVRQMASAGAELLPGCDRRVIERLNATPDPADELDVLVDLLAADLAGWPEDAWIAVDDYQYIGESKTAEAFVEAIIERSPVQMLIATRDRPSWVSTRSVLYGDVLEIGQSLLAMTADEVDDLLAGAHDGMSSGLLALAGGWPAVIGLASLTTTESSWPEEDLELPEQLYEFFAEEVYRGLDPDLRSGLGVLATAPSLDRELAAELLGAERAERVCSEALTLGVLDERGGKLELHPLAAAFMEQRARRERTAGLDDALRTALTVYRTRREWDAAFELLDRRNLAGLDELIEAALDELLNSARLATLESWVTRASRRGRNLPIVLVASGEVDLRHGLHTAAEAVALRAAESSSRAEVKYRALELAARAAHVGSREEEALNLYRKAAVVAPDNRRHRRAMWGQVMCAAALELVEAHELMSDLVSSSTGYDPTESVRLVDKQLSVGFRFGYVRHLKDARRVAELVPSVEDPYARCSFRSMYSWALALGCFYRESNQQAQLLLEDAIGYRVDVAVSHARAILGYSFAGLRRFDEAHQQLQDARAAALALNDPFAEHNAYALSVRTMLEEGRVAEACAMEPPDAADSVRGMRGEVLASRALALATLGRLDEATELGARAAESTLGVETKVLWPAVKCVIALKARHSSLISSAEELVEVAFASGAVDIIVCTYRSNPDLLSTLLTAPGCVERTVYAIKRAGDEAIAAAMGHTVTGRLDPRSTLSVREREVYHLVCAGLTNRGIATRLFITEATVKVHVHSIMDKVGIRSRNALALNAAHERVRQATATSAKSSG